LGSTSFQIGNKFSNFRYFYFLLSKDQTDHYDDNDDDDDDDDITQVEQHHEHGTVCKQSDRPAYYQLGCES